MRVHTVFVSLKTFQAVVRSRGLKKDLLCKATKPLNFKMSRPGLKPRSGSNESIRGVQLEYKLKSYLNVTGIISLCRHQAEGSVWRGGGTRIQTDARAKVWMIKCVQRFTANL